MNRFSPARFARTAGESAHPQLWAGLVGAWCPSLGPTGETLRDWSGFARHGTITNATLSTVWAINGGHVLSPDGTNDYVTLGTSPLYLVSATAFTIVMRIRAVTTSFDGAAKLLLDSCTFNTSSAGIWLALDDRAGPRATDGIGVQIRAATGSREASASNVFSTTEQWKTIVVRYSPSSLRIFVNGADATTSEAVLSSGTGNFVPNNATMTIAAVNDGTLPSTMMFSDLRIYSRPLTDSLIRLDYDIGPGGLYQMRERRRVRRASGNLRRRFMVASA